MAVLNSWQRIDRVLSGKPFGDGVDGNATISSDPNTRTTVTATAGQNTATAGATTIANGDLVMLIQQYGAGAGQWEFNLVTGGGGTVNLTFKKPNQYTYVTGAQILVVPRYLNLTVNAFTGTAWNNSTGGITVLCAKKVMTINGVANLNGANGSISTTTGGGVNTGGGFKGGGVGASTSAYQGQGTGGLGAQSTSANETGGGGGGGSGDQPGGHGGHVTQPTGGGAPGSTGGSADLTNMIMGGGGGGGKQDYPPDGAGAGGNSGGIFVLIAETLTLGDSGGCQVNGGAGAGGTGNQTTARGGEGTGGSILSICKNATLGTNKLTATGGDNPSIAGVGSVGRIAVHHSGTVTGTSNPAFTDIEDSTLVECGNAIFFGTNF